MTLPELSDVLEWLAQEKPFDGWLPEGADADAAMDAADTSACESPWLAARAVLDAALAATPLPAGVGAQVEQIAEQAFMQAWHSCRGHDDVCAQVSDDFELIAQASALRIDSEYISGLWRQYARRVFPWRA
jgi:hypothetical protein